ncbi:hypothetical protein HF086_011135 [Spodoptera exigua]|uniref:ATPase AAA-type core domain-containing protein n=1 Tax=Spodoptera exigua TaxID=7107 RepID=A0A922MYZ8_SPOEX|nr:hypothetical protein HF086_011135 [Spodoptera exigua]
MKEERAKLKAEQKMKAKAAKEEKRKQEEALMKARSNPFSDPGYKIEESAAVQLIHEALKGYRAAWSLFDEMPKERLDLKLLIQKHQADFKSMGMKFPKMTPRRKPKVPPVPKPVIYDKKLMKNTAPVFDMNIVTKPTTKLSDVYGDLNYAAYAYNIKDPNATRKSVMLLGPDKNGKQFLADAVAGELNAIKIDITPEVFTAVTSKPLKVLNQVFITARAFQPAVIFMKNIERVFAIKVPPEDKHLQAQTLKAALSKQIKQISPDDKVIFIATCTNPWMAKAKPMVNIFEEILIVPRTDYGSLQQFLYTKLMK